MKEVINPAYGRFEDFVRRVPRIFSEEGKTIYKARNEIKVFEVDGVELNVNPPLDKPCYLSFFPSA